MSDHNYPMMGITGMCLTQPTSYSFYRERSLVEIETEKNNREVCAYFRILGFGVREDSSRREGIYWHEISDEDGLICQIDGGVALKTLRADMIAWHEGAKPSVGAQDYDIAGALEDDDEFTESFKKLCRFVADKEPEIQLDLL